jgi:predicted ATPase
VLARGLEIARGIRREKDGFFLRAESFYNVATQIEELGVPVQYYGGRSPHQQSHGEAFLSLATNRFAGDGLYLLDEPEAALSPSRQLAFLRLMHQQVDVLNSQFIIATHSPILMAYPDALIYHFTDDGIAPIEYEQTEHYALTRDFLLNPKQYLTHLLNH